VSLQYPVQQDGQESPQAQLASQATLMSLQLGALHSASVMQVPSDPGPPPEQQTRPSAQLEAVPAVQAQPSLTQREPGQPASVWQVPGAPGSPCTQHISPLSQSPSPMQVHPCPVQDGDAQAFALQT
jgi:hypothetical protein